MTQLLIKDSQNREIIKIDGKGQFAIARYPDMDEKFKKYIVDLFFDLTGKNKDETMNFLNYTINENEFCS